MITRCRHHRHRFLAANAANAANAERTGHAARALRGAALLVALLAGCEVVSSKNRQDTTTLPASGASGAAVAGAGGTSGVPAVPATPAESAGAAADSGQVLLAPDHPQRGGVIFALFQGPAPSIPHCSWKGAPLPCYAVPAGVMALVPLPADDPAGTYILTLDRPVGRITRQITVADRDFGRELVFLPESLYALTQRGRDIARDARAVRGLLATETDQRLWNGRWRQPVSGAKSSGYGTERFYFPARDSTRAIKLDASLRTSGDFGVDTTSKPAGVPGWRHAGVDIAAHRGAIVSAPAAGMVADVGRYVLTGNTVLVDHGQGVFTAYFHLDTALVRKGDLLRAGSTIGRVGATGLATAPHLHYGVYIHGRDVDPAAWMAMPSFVQNAGSSDTAHH